MYLREACVETLEEAIDAQQLGADRLEYCSKLEWDGLTPDYEDVKKLLQVVKIPVAVMIRPRRGNFEYSDEEFETMKKSIIDFKKLPVEGVVFGILSGQSIDLARTRTLAELAFPLKVCFHKAIDEVKDQYEAIEQLKSIPQITRVLTSGGKATAQEGRFNLLKMREIAGEQLSILPAGKITPDNIASLHSSIGADEYHGRSIVGRLSNQK